MLRGVNVGGHNIIKMEALRELYLSIGLGKPQTYVQSGNVIFTTQREDLAQLAERIENAIEEKFAFRPDVILRTIDELRDVVSRHPFCAEPDFNPSKLIVTFLADFPTAEARDSVEAIDREPELLTIDGREMFVYFQGGMGSTKLPLAIIAKKLKTPGTGRNWNSVTKILEIAESLQTDL